MNAHKLGLDSSQVKTYHSSPGYARNIEASLHGALCFSYIANIAPFLGDLVHIYIYGFKYEGAIRNEFHLLSDHINFDDMVWDLVNLSL